MTDSTLTPTRGSSTPSPAGNAISFSEAEIDAAIAGERRLKADNIVKGHVMAAMPLGLVPFPLFDLAALTGNHLAMLKSLCVLYQHDCQAAQLRAMLASFLGAALPVITVAGLSSGAKLIPGIGTLIGSGSLAVSAGAVTYAIGQLFIQQVEPSESGSQPGTLRQRFTRELERGKDLVRQWRTPTQDNAA